MRQYFRDPKFAKVGKLFQDIPIEAIDKSLTGMNEAYSKNLERFNLSQAALEAYKVSAEDEDIKQAKIKEYRDQMREFAENEGFEKADAFVGTLASKVVGDKDLQHLTTNYARRQEDEKMLRDMQAQGLTPIDANSIYNGDDFKSITTDVEGNKVYNTYRNRYVKEAEYDKIKSSLFDQMPQTGGTYDKVLPDGSLRVTTVKGITEDSIREYADAAFSRYKSTDAYDNERLKLRVQGIEGAEADKMIKESLVAAGMERKGISTSSRRQGYVNQNVLAAKQAASRATQEAKADTAPRFINQHSSLALQDGSIARSMQKIPGIGIVGMAMGAASDGPSSIPIAGFFNQPVDSTEKPVLFTNHFKIDPENPLSISTDPTKKIGKTETLKASHIGNVRSYVTLDGSEIVMTGETDSDNAKGIPNGQQPQIENGSTFFTTEDGERIYVKPQNFKQYQLEDGEIIFQPMNRDEELRAGGAQAVVNTMPIEVSPQGAGTGQYKLDTTFRMEDIAPSLQAMQYGEKGPQINSYVYNALSKAASYNRTQRDMYNGESDGSEELFEYINTNIQNDPRYQNEIPALLANFVADQGQHDVDGVSVLTKSAGHAVKILNDILLQHEEERTNRQSYKREINKDMSDQYYGSVGSFND